MLEPEVSLYIAMRYIEEGKTQNDVAVSIDGAHVKTKNTLHFDLVGFMRKNGYEKCNHDERWQGVYQSKSHSQRIIVSSQSGEGDVIITLNDGKTMYIESKKFKSGNSGEYPSMREAIGQLMTSCPDTPDTIPIVAVPYSAKSADLSETWSKNERIRKAGICFILVHDNGNIDFISSIC